MVKVVEVDIVTVFPLKIGVECFVEEMHTCALGAWKYATVVDCDASKRCASEVADVFVFFFCFVKREFEEGVFERSVTEYFSPYSLATACVDGVVVVEFYGVSGDCHHCICLSAGLPEPVCHARYQETVGEYFYGLSRKAASCMDHRFFYMAVEQGFSSY